MSISNKEVSQANLSAFNSLISSSEKVLGIKKLDLISRTRRQDVVNVRRMMYHVLRHKYGMTCSTVGKLFEKDHSTVVYLEKSHKIFCRTEPKYACDFELLMSDFEERNPNMMKEMAKKCNAVPLKTIVLNENQQCTISLSCFNEHGEISKFIKERDIKKSRILFCGYARMMNERVASSCVAIDDKRLIESSIRKNIDANDILMNVHPDVYYKDYGKDKYTVLNSAYESYMTAVNLLENKPIVLIYAQKQPLARPIP
jgi:hypothetical protein